jgi:hypothetical protein
MQFSSPFLLVTWFPCFSSLSSISSCLLFFEYVLHELGLFWSSTLFWPEGQSATLTHLDSLAPCGCAQRMTDETRAPVLCHSSCAAPKPGLIVCNTTKVSARSVGVALAHLVDPQPGTPQSMSDQLGINVVSTMLDRFTSYF